MVRLVCALGECLPLSCWFRHCVVESVNYMDHRVRNKPEDHAQPEGLCFKVIELRKAEGCGIAVLALFSASDSKCRFFPGV